MNMLTRRIKTIHRNEQGFASIVIALLLIIILALLTIGFAQLARREQQNALQKQLASQAYDAAESGVNDAYHDITTIDTATGNYYINTTNVPSPTTCITPHTMPLLSTSADTYNQSVNAQNGVSYTCLLVNLAPINILYDNVFPDTSRTITFSTPVTDATLSTLTITWSTADNKTATPSFGGFPPVSSWNSPAVLEASVTPLPAGGLSRASLINDTYTTYMYPSNSNPGMAYAPNLTSPGSQGVLQHSKCTAAGTCTATITGLEASPGAVAGESYNLHILDYYDESQTLTINGTDVNGKAVNFIGQDSIDVTGKSRYVLKRLQERVQPNSLPTLPNYAIEGQNVCKRFSTYPAATTPDASFPTLVSCSSFS